MTGGRPPIRLRTLRGQARIISIGLLVVTTAPALISAVVAARRGWLPVGDNALIGLRISEVLRGHLPLIGQPSASQVVGAGPPTSHPGPIEFYLFTPFAALFGVRAALVLGAAGVNGAAMAGTTWVALRRGGLVAMGLASIVVLLVARSLSGNALHDPISSSIGTLPTLLLAFLAWSVTAGDDALLPLLVLVATFVMQDHLVYLALGGPLVVWAVGTVAWRRRHGAPRRPSPWTRPILAVVALAWLPVVVQELVGHPGNLTALAQTFTHVNPAHHGASGGRLSFAIGRLAYSMAPPTLLRPLADTSYLT
ncbi:MAG TPA: hypothetical protein VGM93_05930, partial [Acidimicrobiales bacterium]